MIVRTLPDIVGAVTQALSTKSVPCRWVMLTAVTSGGSTAAVVADSASDATHGAHLIQGVPVFYPESHEPNAYYDLANLTAYVPSGTTLTISYCPA